MKKLIAESSTHRIYVSETHLYINEWRDAGESKFKSWSAYDRPVDCIRLDNKRVQDFDTFLNMLIEGRKFLPSEQGTILSARMDEADLAEARRIFNLIFA